MSASVETSTPTTAERIARVVAQRHDGSSDALTLTEVFEHAADLRRLAVEPDIRAFALVQVLVTMLHHRSPQPIDRRAWERCWHEQRLPVDVAERFDPGHQLRQPDLAAITSAGHVDGILIEGQNILQTLLLNLIPHDAGLQRVAVSHLRPERRLRHGITALLTNTTEPPAALQWLAQVSSDVLAPSYVAQVRAITSGCTPRTSIVDHQVSVPARVLRPERSDLRAVILRAIDDVDLAVLAYAQLRDDLDRAGEGAGGTPVRDAACAEALAYLEPHLRRWMGRLGQPNVAAQDASADWSTTARKLLLRLAQHAVAGCDVASLRTDPSVAEASFGRTLSEIFADN